ncbi:beta-1,6-N-acetylglucosaminyltransferase [Clostridium perfringens]|uniref:beta-1,6-N-acetylglucosaminyltransferase n=1 Tax=Clostridium perfringens TaxID=1502 RepID=UPI00210D268E|nr:beta-1,6-N-acetylglucosaminyltransferase [Clostridium perfringens]
MNIAYCILCHKNSNVLRECINYLSPQNDLFIHVDKKSNINDFSEYNSKVIFVKNRIDVKWGHFSQVEATLQLLKETNIKHYDYIFLLSGDCLPIKSEKFIKEFLEKNYPNEYIALDKNYKEIKKRIEYKYNSLYYKKNCCLFIRIIRKIQSKFNILPKNKLFRELPKLYKGTQWFGITGKLKVYILDFLRENPRYIEAFKNSFCCDEIFFHTIIFNSEFKDYVYDAKDKSNICFQALRYIDWKSGPDYPKILNEDDFDKMLKSECLFARKFDENIDFNLYKHIFLEVNQNLL